MALATVVDYSKYQGTVSRTSHRAMREAGVAGVVVGLWHGLDINPYALSCLANAKAEQLLRGGYVVVNNRSGREAVLAGKQAAGGHWPDLFGVAIDVEIKGVTEAIMADAFDEVLRQGQRPFLYTGNWFWNWWALELGHFPDASAFAAWIAYYNGVADLASVPPRPGYGPIIGHQYAGSTAAFGTTVDFNVFDTAWLAGSQEEDDMMTDQQIAEAIGRIARAGQLGLDKGIVGTEKLLDLIGDLKSEIAALKARVAAVEAAPPAAGVTEERVKEIVRELVAE